MADAIELFIDVSTPTGAAVKSLSDRSAFALGPFYQGSLLKLRVYPVVPTGSGTLPPFFAKVAIDNIEMLVTVGPRAGTEAIKAAQYVWSKQLTADSEGKSGYFYADLNLNTTDLNNLISTNDTITTFFEVQFSRAGGAYSPVFQSQITLLAVVKDPGSAASIPTPTIEYLTVAQGDNKYVQWRNDLIPANAGRNIVLLSPDSARTRELGVGNDGEPIDNN